MLDADGLVKLRGQGSPETFAELTAELVWSGPVYALLPGETALLTSADIPSRQKRQIVLAVPNMVEDDLANEAHDCHFALGDRLESGAIAVAVIERNLLADSIERLTGVGLKPSFLKLDTLSVPFDGHPTVVVEDGRVHLRTGTASGLSMESELAGTALSLLDDGAVRLYTCADSGDSAAMLVAQLGAETDGAIEVHQQEGDCFDLLCKHYDANTINLLQGEFEVQEVRSKDTSGWATVWRLAAAVFVLQVLLHVGQGLYLDATATQLEADAHLLYAETFPADRNVRDVRARWQAHLGAGSGDSTGGFLTLFGATSKQLPGSGLELGNVNYNESRGDLILQIEAPRSEQLVSFSQTLTGSGLSAEIGTINQDAEQVKGSIKVRTQ